MALITTRGLSIGFRGPPLLDNVTCQIEAGQQIGLLGRNGSGKTTFLRLLSGVVEPDAGEVVISPGTTVALLPQDIPQQILGRVGEVVANALPPGPPEEEWKNQHAVAQILQRMNLDADDQFDVLSSGMKRRVLLARTIVAAPSVLLLDEPTNHLDIQAITWLEGFLGTFKGTLIFVTHDRMFLRKLARRILEIDHGHLFDWVCNYDTFLHRKEAALRSEEKQSELFDKKLAQEEAWIRQGIKARRTRNEGRVRALKEMRQLRSERRPTIANVKLEIDSRQRSGNLVAEVKDLSFAYHQEKIVDGFSTTIMRGDKIGIIGPNGVGKTTLLRLLLGQLTPQAGTVRMGTHLQVAYFDQLRKQLNEDRTVAENVGDGYKNVGSGDKSRHIIGYLQNFLFSPERARTPVRFLSGGERNRVLLARLFAKPANVIVLDEPTNDLDADTLEVLETRLVEFDGAVLLVSHDREFLNHVVTSTVVFEPEGVREYVGGYDDWLQQRAASPRPPITTGSVASGPSSSAASPSVRAPHSHENRDPAKVNSGPRRLKYKEKQELTELPSQIEQLEAETNQLHEKMAFPDFYRQPADEIARDTAHLRHLEEELAKRYQRWEELEQIEN
jgi:ATP-binding cassette subfamily F protein uup